MIMACRNKAKAEVCRESLERELNTHRLNLSIKLCDLSSLRSIERFVEEFRLTEDRLDVLICNAGLARSERKLSEDSLDFVIQSNYLGHFYLVNLLKDLLEKCRPSRIIHVSSDLHRG